MNKGNDIAERHFDYGFISSAIMYACSSIRRLKERPACSPVKGTVIVAAFVVKIHYFSFPPGALRSVH